jgi:hypothetical protein
VFWIFYAFFWVIPRRLNFISRRFGTLCSIFIPPCLWRWNRQSVPKRRNIKFRRPGITQKKTKYKNNNSLSLNKWYAELNPICPLLALFRAHHILHVSRIRDNKKTHARNPYRISTFLWRNNKRGAGRVWPVRWLGYGMDVRGIIVRYQASVTYLPRLQSAQTLSWAYLASITGLCGLLKVKQPHYRPGVAQRFPGIKVPRLHDNGTGRW